MTNPSYKAPFSREAACLMLETGTSTPLAAVRAITKRFLEPLRNDLAVPVPLHQLCNAAGIENIFELDEREPYEAKLLPSQNGFVVGVKPNLSSARFRFTICHEIAHTLIYAAELKHPEVCDFVQRGDSVALDQEELLCQEAAAMMLLPEDQFRVAFRESPNPFRLATLFDVAPEPVVRRAWSLGIEGITVARLIPVSLEFSSSDFFVAWSMSRSGPEIFERGVRIPSTMASKFAETFFRKKPTKDEFIIRNGVTKSVNVFNIAADYRNSPCVLTLVVNKTI